MMITNSDDANTTAPTSLAGGEAGASVEPRILTVTVAHDSSDVIYEHLKSLIASTDFSWSRHIIVDNSADERCRQIVLQVQEEFPSRFIRYLALDGNPGYGTGVNLGLRMRTSEEYVFISNPDSVVSGSSRLSDLVAVAEEWPDAAAVLPDVLHPQYGRPVVRRRLPTPLTYSGWVAGTWLRARFLKSAPGAADDDPEPVNAGDGSALLLSPGALNELGGFDSRFFLFMEDTDLWKRIGDAGLQVIQVRNCTVLHVGAGSSSVFGKTNIEMAALSARGIYFEKFYGRKGLAIFLLQMVPEAVVIAVVRAMRNRDFRYLLDIRKMFVLALAMWTQGPVGAQDLMVRPLFGSTSQVEEPGMGLSSRQ